MFEGFIPIQIVDKPTILLFSFNCYLVDATSETRSR